MLNTDVSNQRVTLGLPIPGLTPFQFGQWEGKRLTAHYGSGYDFTRQRVAGAPPLPGWLIELRDKLAP